VKVDTPLGEYPFEFRRLERRGADVVIVGLVGGLKSELVVSRGEALAALGVAAGALSAAAALGYLRRASR
jgi:hypothetical protein